MSDPKSAVFDIDEAVARLGLPVDRVVALVRQFADKYRNVDKEIAALIQDENWKEAEALAHSLKGTALTLGAQHLGQAASMLEFTLNARDHKNLSAISGVFYSAVDSTFDGMR